MPSKEDRVLRAMTNDGAFRVMTARTTETVRAALKAQGIVPSKNPAEANALGEMLTSAVLFRETMAPTLRVQGVLKGAAGSGQVVADSHPDGWSRALLQQKGDAGPFSLGEGALLQMMRSLPNGELHQGVVSVPEGGGVSEALMQYLQQSEQVTSMLQVALCFEEDELVAAGGYLVQALPEAPDREAAVMVMSQRLEDDFSDIHEGLRKSEANPRILLEELLHGMEFTHLDDTAIRPGCECSRDRVLGSLRTLGSADLEDLASAGESLDMSCDWCGQQYIIEVGTLEALAKA